MTDKQFAILKQTVEAYGNEIQSTIAAEECAELIQAISKVRRFGCTGKYRDNLVEEMADVMIILQELAIMYNVGIGEYNAMIQSKIKRIQKRLRTNNRTN
jgi:NTP pyrophosphatase (non-canonical NTP hydrolase)